MGTINSLLSSNPGLTDKIGKTSFWGTKTYLTFSKEKGYELCNLGVFQRIFRSVFGCSENTHLRTVLFALNNDYVNQHNAAFYTRFFRWIGGFSSTLPKPFIDLTLKLQKCWNNKYPKAPIDLNQPYPTYCSLSPAQCICKQARPFRASIFNQTMYAAKNGFLVGSEKVFLDRNTELLMQKNTLVMRSKPLSVQNVYGTTKVQVVNQDCADFAFKLKRQGYNPVILNMANEDTPGGGVKYGSSAQEESLCIRSNYMVALDPENNPYLKHQMPYFANYKIPENGVIYTPSVQFFRDERSNGYHFKHPETMDIIACAAYNIKHGGRLSNYVEGMKEKIRAILSSAFIKGNDSIVFSALGCGAFGNDSKEVADIFASVLKEPQFQGKFRKITFAIIDDRNGANFKPFYNRLQGLKI